MIHPHDEYPTGGAGRGKPAPSTPLQVYIFNQGK